MDDKASKQHPWKPVSSTHGVGVWKSIRNLWPKFENNSYFKVGNGARISFWEDKRIGQTPLKQPYPDIYNLNQQEIQLFGDIWATKVGI